jgi:hypothetical protein
MEINMWKLFVTNLFVILALPSWAQPDKIEIEGKGNREVEPAFRITEAPKIIDSIKITPVASYPTLIYQAKTKITLDTIEAATVETTEKLKQIYPFYIKAGMGSSLMPLGELYFNNTRSRTYHYGFHTQHISAFGKVKDREGNTFAPANFDRTHLRAFGKIIQNNYQLIGSGHYQNEGFHYYGIPDENRDKDSLAQRFQQGGGAVDFVSTRGDTSILNFKLGASYNYFGTKKNIVDSLADWRAKEHLFHFKTKGWYKYGNETFYANLGVRYNGFRYGIADSSRYQQINDTSSVAIDSGLVLNNAIIDFRPGVLTQLLDNRLKVNVGLSLAVDVHRSTKVYVYPQVDLSFSVYDNVFIPFVGITGGLHQNTFRSLAAVNPFIVNNAFLLNEHNPFQVYGGFKGTLSKKISFNTNISYGRFMNRALFANQKVLLSGTDSTYVSTNKFDVIYDTLNQMKIEASFAYQMSEKLKIDALGRFYSYETKNQAFAWNLPQLQFILRGSYNLFDKFLLNIDGTLEGGRKALVHGPGSKVKVENGQYYVDLGFIADFNLGLEYRYNQRVSAFVQFNNFAAQRYNRWYNYPVLPFQVMGGITARF